MKDEYDANKMLGRLRMAATLFIGGTINGQVIAPATGEIEKEVTVRQLKEALADIESELQGDSNAH